MAIVSDRKMIYERKIAELQTQLTQVSGGSGVRMTVRRLWAVNQTLERTDFCPNLFQDEPMDTDQSSTFLSSIQSEIAKYQLLIEEENQKLKRYKVSFCHLCNDIGSGGMTQPQSSLTSWSLLFIGRSKTFGGSTTTFLSSWSCWRRWQSISSWCRWWRRYLYA